MFCELCGQDSNLFMLLPIHQPDGRLNVTACKKCALNSSAYCQTHKEIHQGFIDGSTACLKCVEQVARSHATIAGELCDRIMEALPKYEVDDLLDAAKTSAFITKVPTELALVRFLASKAMRTKQTVEEVMMEVIRSKSARYILWM